MNRLRWIAAAIAVTALAGCIFAISAPVRTRDGSTITLTVDLGPVNYSIDAPSDAGRIGVCFELPTAWVLGAVTYSLEGGASQSAAAGTVSEATPPARSGFAWSCVVSNERPDVGDRALMTAPVTVHGPGGYDIAVQVTKIDETTSMQALARRHIAVDAMPPFDATATVLPVAPTFSFDGPVVASPSTFVLLNSNDDTVQTSPDGVTWTTVTVPGTPTLRAIAYGNGTFVVVGNNSFIATSPDGTTWSPPTTGLPVSATLRVIFYDGARFVLSGEDVIYASPDNGATWTDVRGPTVSGAFISGGIATATKSMLMNSTGSTVIADDDGIFNPSEFVFDITPSVEESSISLAYSSALGVVGTSASGLIKRTTDFESLTSVDVPSSPVYVSSFNPTASAIAFGDAVYVTSISRLLKLTAAGVTDISSSSAADASTSAATDKRILFLGRVSGTTSTAFAIDLPKLAVNVDSLAFSAASQTQNVIVTNNGGGTLFLQTPTTDAGFTVTGCDELAVAEGATCTLAITAPAASANGTLTIVSNGVGTATHGVALTLTTTDGGEPDPGETPDDTDDTNDSDDANDDEGCAAAPMSCFAMLAAAVLLRRRRPR